MSGVEPESVQIARLEEQFRAMREWMQEMAEAQRETQRQLAELQRQLEQARGGWRTLMWLGGAAASLGACASWIASHVRFQ